MFKMVILTMNIWKIQGFYGQGSPPPLPEIYTTWTFKNYYLYHYRSYITFLLLI
jgi:hypothetical protein